jgi:hypothetical protein
MRALIELDGHGRARYFTDQKLLSSHGMRYLTSASVPIFGSKTAVWLGGSYGHARGTIDSEKGHTFLLTLDFAPPKAADLAGLKQK